jgi:magnesium transporter
MPYDQTKHESSLQATLAQIVGLLDKQELVSSVSLKQSPQKQDLVQTIVAKQQLVELQKRLDQLHPADLAFVLEGLPLDRRERVWGLVRADRRGAVLLELSDAVRDHLLGEMKENEIIGAAEHLDSDEIAYLLPSLPKDTVMRLLSALDREDRTQVQTALTFPPGTVGSLMGFDMVTVREEVDVEVVLRYLRKLGGLPDRADQLFIVDRAGTLKGVLPTKALLIHSPDVPVAEVMNREPIVFHTDDPAREAVLAFERYDLISAPVVNLHQQLVGIITIDAVMDFINEAAQREQLKKVGLKEEEDIFAPLWKSAKNRWAWLATNLVTAFIASRIIGVFEGTIEKLVAVAALMPIVASIAGNTGNQTVALVIRGLALDQINPSKMHRLLFKEIGISFMNGAVWGSIVGLFAFVFYAQLPLALVMAGAVMLNLLIASLVGVFIPLTLHKLGRDPVLGSSVMLTAVTDSMGFFIFLGLATVLLLQ